MKNKFFIIILFATLLFSACKTDNSMGLSIQPPQDAIKVLVDTFHVASADFIYDSISAQCNDSLSMLLGEYYSAKYGTTKADLLVQIAPPLNYEFPDEAQYHPQADSVLLMLFYTQWYGSESEPLEVSVYEIDKKTPEYSAFYPINFDINEFVNVNNNNLLGSKISTTINQTLPDSLKDGQGAGALHTIRYKFGEQWTQDFFTKIKEKQYTKTEEFLPDFKGFYITTAYGQSTMLYLFRIDMRFYYHYSYVKNGKDTFPSQYIEFPANKEVRQLNRISHINTQNLINQRDSVNYIKTGGGIYPKITLPLGAIRKKIVENGIKKEKLTINSAIFSVEATEIDNAKNAMPIPKNMLLLPADELKNFVEIDGIKSVENYKGVIVSYNSAKKEYTFDIAHTLNKLLNPKDKREDSADNSFYENFDETAEYVLVPVDIYSTNGVISDIRAQKTIGAATIRSAKNGHSPMRIELVYSGF